MDEEAGLQTERRRKQDCRQREEGSRAADRGRDKRRQSSVTFGGEENKKKCMKGNCRWVKVVLTDLMEGDAFTPGEEATATKRMFWLKRSDLHGVAKQPEVCTLSQSQHLFSPLSPYNRCLPELERRSEGEREREKKRSENTDSMQVCVCVWCLRNVMCPRVFFYFFIFFLVCVVWYVRIVCVYIYSRYVLGRTCTHLCLRVRCCARDRGRVTQWWTWLSKLPTTNLLLDCWQTIFISS